MTKVRKLTFPKLIFDDIFLPGAGGKTRLCARTWWSHGHLVQTLHSPKLKAFCDQSCQKIQLAQDRSQSSETITSNNARHVSSNFSARSFYKHLRNNIDIFLRLCIVEIDSWQLKVGRSRGACDAKSHREYIFNQVRFDSSTRKVRIITV